MKRNPYFDNAKWIFIFLVVFGHMIQPFTNESDGVRTLYMWIYTFHMPAFIFLAGFFAKGSGNWSYILNLGKKLLVPYLIFQLLYTAYYLFIGKVGWQNGLFYPHWSLWFLFSLFSWHILLILFKKVPALFSMAAAVLVGILIGYFDDVGQLFSLSRTFVFFPFFLLGFWVTEKQVMWLKKRAVKMVALLILIGVGVAIYIAPDFNSGWLFASKSYNDLSMPTYGGFARLLIYVTSTLMSASALAWAPTAHTRLTWLGTRTLYVYLLHGFFIQYFRQVELFSANNVIDVIGLAIVSAGIVLLLSIKPVIAISQPLIEGKLSMLKQGFEKNRDDGTQYN